MKTCKHLTYTRKIQWRIRALWLLLTGMLVYMVLIAELGVFAKTNSCCEAGSFCSSR